MASNYDCSLTSFSSLHFSNDSIYSYRLCRVTVLGLPLTIFGRCGELFILVNKKKYISIRKKIKNVCTWYNCSKSPSNRGSDKKNHKRQITDISVKQNPKCFAKIKSLKSQKLHRDIYEALMNMPYT